MKKVNMIQSYALNYSISRFILQIPILLFMLIIVTIQGCSTSNGSNNNVLSIVEKKEVSDTLSLVDSQETDIWNTTAYGIDVRWTTTDLYLVHSNGTVESLFSDLAKSYEKSMNASSNGEYKCNSNHAFELLSMVGPFLSFRDTFFTVCSNSIYTSKTQSIYVIDIRKYKNSLILNDPNSGDSKSSRKVSIFSIYNESDIFKSLMNTGEIARTLPYADKFKKPRNLTELIKAVEEVGADGIDNTGLKITPDTWNSFFFDDYLNDDLIVAIEIKSIPSPSTQLIPLKLSVHHDFLEDVKSASSGKSGILGKKLTQIANGRQTEIIYNSFN